MRCRFKRTVALFHIVVARTSQNLGVRNVILLDRVDIRRSGFRCDGAFHEIRAEIESSVIAVALKIYLHQFIAFGCLWGINCCRATRRARVVSRDRRSLHRSLPSATQAPSAARQVSTSHLFVTTKKSGGSLVEISIFGSKCLFVRTLQLRFEARFGALRSANRLFLGRIQLACQLSKRFERFVVIEPVENRLNTTCRTKRATKNRTTRMLSIADSFVTEKILLRN